MLSRITGAFRRRSASHSGGRGRRIGKVLGVIIVIYLLVVAVLGMFWSTEPEPINVRQQAQQMSGKDSDMKIGVATTATTIVMVQTLLNKSGGYITNDVFPPGLWMDNMSHWEFGVLVQMRDITRAMRRDMSRSQSQSAEDKDLIIAEPQMNFDNNSWVLPSTEKEYRKGARALQSYLKRLESPSDNGAQFYARADNLITWLSDVETRLGSLSRRLSESVGKQRPGETTTGSVSETANGGEVHKRVKTPWTKLDDVFYEARGTSWSLLNLFRAIKIDFRDVLIDKNAMVSVEQILLNKN